MQVSTILDVVRVLIVVYSWRGRRRNKRGQLWLGALDLAQLDLHIHAQLGDRPWLMLASSRQPSC